jgi:hypothetical protein
MALALVATLAFSLAPSVRVWSLNALPLLKAGEHGVVRGRTRLAAWLVVCQFAFSVLLVTAAGLAHRSMSLFDSADVGFARDNLLLVTTHASANRGSPGWSASARAWRRCPESNPSRTPAASRAITSTPPGLCGATARRRAHRRSSGPWDRITCAPSACHR